MTYRNTKNDKKQHKRQKNAVLSYKNYTFMPLKKETRKTYNNNDFI